LRFGRIVREEGGMAVQKKNLVFKKFGLGKRRDREPLSQDTKAALFEKIQQHKEYLRRGDAFKKNSTKMFGGND
jgi:hypothetical protein